MKVAIITTVDHNVGDDFVREGLKFLFKKAFKKKKIEFINIHKHSPITVRDGFEKIRNQKASLILDSLLPQVVKKDKILSADLIVQSGAPVYWCHTAPKNHCYNNEWFKPLIIKRFTRNKKAKLLNLAAGTCQKYNSKGNDFCSKCRKYIKKFYKMSSLTTVRDGLAKKVLANAGINATLVPCSSIFATDEHKLKSLGEKYVVVNYMRGGAHYTLGQKINFNKWEREFKKFYHYLKKKEKVIFSCHNAKEVKVAKRVDPQANIFYRKNDYLAYMKFYAKAKFGIVNRVHAAFLMASYGKPSIVIGNDSRARMVEEIKLRSYFVNDVDCKLLIKQYKQLQKDAKNYAKKFQTIKNKAYKNYSVALTKILKAS